MVHGKGGMVIPCGCGGSYLGGFLIKHFRMKPPGILKLSILWIGLGLASSLGFMVRVIVKNKPFHSDIDLTHYRILDLLS